MMWRIFTGQDNKTTTLTMDEQMNNDVYNELEYVECDNITDEYLQDEQ